MTIGEIIKRFRKENNMTIQEFADQSGLSKAYVSILENGKRFGSNKKVAPTMETYNKVSSAMGVSVNSLINAMNGEEDEAEPLIVTIPLLDNVSWFTPIERINKSIRTGDKLGLIGLDCKVIDEIPIKASITDSLNYFALELNDSKSYPKMEKGDLLIVHKQETAKTMDFVIASINGGPWQCRVFYNNGSEVSLTPFDYKFFRERIDIKTDEMKENPMLLKIIGKVEYYVGRAQI